jgi:uncharacterized membrane protein YeaQ/YmgE (transglycosylase-associated protein family)
MEVTILDLIAWIVLGAIAGWLAGVILGGHGLGVIGTVVLGIVGAILGGFLASALGLPSGGAEAGELNLVSIIVAVIGALVVVGIASLVTGRRTVT